MNQLQRIIWKAKRTPTGYAIHYLKVYLKNIKNKAKPIDELTHYLSIAACVKNEGRYLREWIEYHLWAGFEHFYIYDNGSTDNTKEVLSPYIMSGIVTYNYYVEREPQPKGRQIRMYNDAIARYKHCTKWLAIIDADEFIALSEEGKKRFGGGGGGVLAFFKRVEKYPAVAINWICFDGGGHEKMPESGYVIDNYTRIYKDSNQRSIDKHVKSVVQPLRVKCCPNPHYCFCKRLQKTVDENLRPVKGVFTKANSTSVIRINHYFTKSKEEYLEKINVRGDVNNMKRNYNESDWSYPEWKNDDSMKEAALALRAKGVPETYGGNQG